MSDITLQRLKRDGAITERQRAQYGLLGPLVDHPLKLWDAKCARCESSPSHSDCSHCGLCREKQKPADWYPDPGRLRVATLGVSLIEDHPCWCCR